MKREWSFIIVILFAIIVAIFAVINVEAVEVDYLFGTAQWPLVLVILGSTMLGALAVGFAGAARFLSMKKELRTLKNENQQYRSKHTSPTESTGKDLESIKNTDQSTKPTNNSPL